jgi:hypothetical protein
MRTVKATDTVLERVEWAMRDQTLHQSDLVNEDLSASVVSKFFRRKNVRPETARMILEAVGLNWKKLAPLFDEEDEAELAPTGSDSKRKR